jgi:hypothetical protein
MESSHVVIKETLLVRNQNFEVSIDKTISEEA